MEIGPGGTPYQRADVLLELRYPDETEAKKQRGGTPSLQTRKPVVYYEGGVLPFADREFDYVVCSHVLEHVDDVEFFLSEMFRVGDKGYVEYPTIYYEYLYNFSVHSNVFKYQDGVLYYLKKADVPLDVFLPVQRMFFRSLELGHTDFVDRFGHIMFEGFEWHQPFSCARTKSIRQVAADNLGSIPPRVHGTGILARIQRALCSMARG